MVYTDMPSPTPPARVVTQGSKTPDATKQHSVSVLALGFARPLSCLGSRVNVTPSMQLDVQSAQEDGPQEPWLLKDILALFKANAATDGLEASLWNQLACLQGRLPPPGPPRPDASTPAPRIFPGQDPLSLLKLTTQEPLLPGHVPTTLLDSRHCWMEAEF